MNASIESRERISRRQARASGLRLSRSSGLYRLVDDTDELIIEGPLQAIENHLGALRPTSKPGPPSTAVPTEWVGLINAYVRTLAAAGQRPATLRLRRAQLAQMVRELDCVPAAVSTDTLIGWLGDHRDWTPETRRSARAAVKGFFSWAARAGHVAPYVGDDLPRVRERVGLPHPAPDEALASALSVADRRTVLMIRLAAEAGLRRAEVAGLRVRNLRHAPGGAELAVDGKGGKQRVVPISDELAEMIERVAAGSTATGPVDYVFPARGGGHLEPGSVGRLVAAALPDGWSMHSLRHRFATRAYRGTRNLRAVQELLGHGSVATTMRYTAVDTDELRAAATAARNDVTVDA